jgi:hypothetical protein
MQRRIFVFLSIATLLAILCSTALAQYQLTNLVSNQSGQALHQDPLLVNAWGLVHAPGSPWWISTMARAGSTLYNSTGVARALQVVVPAAKNGATGSSTGIVFNGSSEFDVQGWPSIFLFATLDGTISGWAQSENFTVTTVRLGRGGKS